MTSKNNFKITKSKSKNRQSPLESATLFIIATNNRIHKWKKITSKSIQYQNQHIHLNFYIL
jgi:hypothetical protein